jgi:putative transposase
VLEIGMPSTHLSLQCHFVFSTKDRRPFIDAEWRPDLHRYLGACLKKAGCVALDVGGVDDHVHIVAGLRATHCVANVLHDIKKASSLWVHREIRVPAFKWQEGYGAFTISQSNLPRVRSYVARQEAHHRKRTFQEEYLELLIKHGIEFDERYLW